MGLSSRRALVGVAVSAIAMAGSALESQTPGARGFTRADTLRGSFTTPWRVWWDVVFYDLRVAVNPADSSIRGSNGIAYRVLQPAQELQVDLMTPLEVDSVVQDGRPVPFRREGNAFFATLPAPQRQGEIRMVTVYYHGKPRVAPRPPWDGGFSWTQDSLARPWVVTTDQGMGASVWWPNKDTQADEPDSQRVAITVPAPISGRWTITWSPPGDSSHRPRPCSSASSAGLGRTPGMRTATS
jgi:hypothetical protein